MALASFGLPVSGGSRFAVTFVGLAAFRAIVSIHQLRLSLPINGLLMLANAMDHW
jgi:hypothetical protein